MNILVTGGNGQLGSTLKDIVKSNPHNNNYIFTDFNELDITDFNNVRKYICDNDIKMVINCAAYTNVDGAENNPIITTMLNTNAVTNLSQIMRDVDGTLIHISTDYVFGSGYNTPIQEDDEMYPCNVYGITKSLGEIFIRKNSCKYLIFRTSWLYSEYGKNFVKTMLELTENKPELKVVFDQVGSPTYAYDLGKTIFDIIEKELYEGNEGVYHYSNEGVCTWYDFAKLINKYSGHKCNIKPCRTSELTYQVKRPSYSVLDKTKIKNTFGISIPYWTKSLRTCLKNIKE